MSSSYCSATTSPVSPTALLASLPQAQLHMHDSARLLTLDMAAEPGARPRTPSALAKNRRSHAKSRLGCRTCKKRKIKCDEQQPSCRNCTKHAVTCDFLQSQTRRSPAPSSAPASTFQLPGNLLSQNHQIHSQGGLNMIDLELIHNFTTFTHATLSNDAAVRQMFRTSAIQMAFECELLMRAILAVSALHLAHFRRDNQHYYTNIGLQHHQVASRLAVPIMDNVSSLRLEDCENLHLFSALTLYFALGSPKSDCDSLIIGDSVIPDWLFMLRSSEPILNILDPSTYKGPLAPLFAFGKERWYILHGEPRPHCTSLLTGLQSFVNRSCKEPELLPVYNDVIEFLRRILSMLVLNRIEPEDFNNNAATVTSPPMNSSLLHRLEAWDVFLWLWDAAKDFVPLLKGPKPRQEAVVIYAHFLIMLKKLENQWWLEGWARHMIERIWGSLDQEHRPWIQWPIEELGWVPPRSRY